MITKFKMSEGNEVRLIDGKWHLYSPSGKLVRALDRYEAEFVNCALQAASDRPSDALPSRDLMQQALRFYKGGPDGQYDHDVVVPLLKAALDRPSDGVGRVTNAQAFDSGLQTGMAIAKAEAVATDRLSDALPPLPLTNYNGYADGSEPLYTAEHMRDYANAAIADLDAAMRLQTERLIEARDRSSDAELTRLREIARLIGSIFVHGDFKAETYNERQLEKLLREQGTFFDSLAEYDAAQAALAKLCDQLSNMKHTMFRMPDTGQHYSYLVREDVLGYVEEARVASDHPSDAGDKND